MAMSEAMVQLKVGLLGGTTEEFEVRIGLTRDNGLARMIFKLILDREIRMQ
jgi:hypothetical protein